MVLYRKYRPQLLSQLDQNDVRERLSSLIASGTIPHAFLFTGPKGTGKTSAARIMAKVINCEARNKKQEVKSKEIEPCNVCDTCVSITKGTNLDILEIDAASNRGIDEIRSLRDKIKLTPVSAHAKVYIIDEVHMLTTEAFNALLKTIEEPPSHAFFILATTDADKLPATITSRCFTIQFHKATPEELLHALDRVVKGEKIKAEPKTLSMIAGMADGAFRDAIKFLEEAVGGTDEIHEENIVKIAGSAQADWAQFLTFIAHKQTPQALALIDTLVQRGVNIRLFLEKILSLLQNELLASYGVGGKSPSTNLSSSDIRTLMLLFSRAALETRNSPITQLPLELAVVAWGEKEKEEQSPEKAEKLEKKQTESLPPKAESRSIQSAPAEEDLKQAFIDATKPHNHSIAALLRSCSQLTLKDDTVMIEAKYQFHYDRLQEPKTMALLQQVGSEILGKKVQIKLTFTK